MNVENVRHSKAVKEWMKIKLSIDVDKYNKLIAIANDVDMNLYTLLRTVIDYCIAEHEASKDGDKK